MCLKVFCCVISLVGFCAVVEAGTFEIGEKDFLLNNKPVVICSGELHYSRIPRAYWQHRLQMCKAMGLNTVCAYMFWNIHEPEPGQFDFSGSADVSEFCRLAQKEGLMVILRPGPYSCAEWDLGGFPYWLLKDPEMKLRTRYPGYIEACKRYIMRVGQELVSLQISNGGPIIMVQVENEYGSYGSDKEYIGTLRDYWSQAGFVVPFFTCDGPTQLANDFRDDIFAVVNFGGNPENAFDALRKHQKTGPLMCGEFYPAWFDHWGEKHHTKPAEAFIPDLKKMLDQKASFSLYMVHGGTSFGFSAGANYSHRYAPQTTSYDYDAPISEAGWPTPKYLALRKLYSQYLQPGETLPEIPDRNPVITIPEIRFLESISLLADTGTPVTTENPRSFETCGQNQGCILYKAMLPAGNAGTVLLPFLNDYARISIDGKHITTYDRRTKKGKWITGFSQRGQNIITKTNEDYTVNISIPKREKEVALEILVEALGHVNYGGTIDFDRKGISGKVFLKVEDKTSIIKNWSAYLLPLNSKHLSRVKFGEGSSEMPAFYRATFTLQETGDTFLDLSSWGKGVVWVNGHNLGRYWRIGPQQTLYLPAPWLKTGENEIVVLELLNAEKAVVQGLENPILDQNR